MVGAWNRGLKAALVIFILAFGVRILLNLAFFSLYGPHAVNHEEIWLYFGVASGTHKTATGGADPTGWLLRGMGEILHGDALFYSIGVLSIFLTAAASILIWAIVREVYDEKAARYAGLIYAFMVQPLSLSLVGFTHDHLLTPILLSSLLMVVIASKSAGGRRMVFAAAAALLFYLGVRVHIGAYVLLAVVAVFFASELVKGRPRIYPVFISGLVVCSVLGGACLLPGALDYVLGNLPQGRMGSGDVVPVTALGFFMKYNLLLLLLPFGAVAAYRKRESIGVAYALIGFALCVSMERGSRLSDIGVAILASYALAEWPKGGKAWFVPLSLAALSLALIALPLPPVFIALFAASGLSFALSLKDGKNIGRAVAVVCASAVLASLLIVSMDTSRAVVAESEYALYSTALKDTGGKKVLAAWDRGYLIETASGSKAASSPGVIDYSAHEALWMPEEQAYELLKRRGIGYVVFSDRNYNEIVHNGTPYYVLEGGLVLTPRDLPPISLSESLTAHKLRYGGTDPGRFKAVAVADDLLGGQLKVYKVGDSGPNRTLISIIALNNEGRDLTAKVDVAVAVYKGGIRPAPKRQTMLDEMSMGGLFPCMMRASAALAAAASFIILLISVRKAYALRGRKGMRWRRYAAYSAAALVLSAAAAYLTSDCCAANGALKDEPAASGVVHRTFTADFPASNVTEASFDVGDVGDVGNCTVTLEGDEPWGYVGSVTFRNLCDSLQEKAKILLVDVNASAQTGKMAVEDEVDVDLRLAKGAERTVNYSFKREYPQHAYAVGFWKSQCVAADGTKSQEPHPAGVEVIHTFCGRATDLRDYSKIT